MAKKYMVNGEVGGSIGHMGRIYHDGEEFPVETSDKKLVQDLISQKLIIEMAAEQPAIAVEPEPAVEKGK